jgi:hypothetical protein
MDSTKLNDFATKYTVAWCSQNAASVAAFFGDLGSLKVNEGNATVGRTATTAGLSASTECRYQGLLTGACRALHASGEAYWLVVLPGGRPRGRLC